MDIGFMLKNAREAKEFTQEQIAEKLGVSRQTISNWENNRSYPDILSVVELSDIYEITLDELIKGDKKMLTHLEESTNVVKTNRKLTKVIEIAVYLFGWALSFSSIMMNPNDDGGIAFLTIYLLLPITGFVISVYIGRDSSWGKAKWLMPLFFGVMNVLVGIAFPILNAGFVLREILTYYSFADLPLLLIFCAVQYIGVALGYLLLLIKKNKK